MKTIYNLTEEQMIEVYETVHKEKYAPILKELAFNYFNDYPVVKRYIEQKTNGVNAFINNLYNQYCEEKSHALNFYVKEMLDYINEENMSGSKIVFHKDYLFYDNKKFNVWEINYLGRTYFFSEESLSKLLFNNEKQYKNVYAEAVGSQISGYLTDEETENVSYELLIKKLEEVWKRNSKYNNDNKKTSKTRVITEYNFNLDLTFIQSEFDFKIQNELHQKIRELEKSLPKIISMLVRKNIPDSGLEKTDLELINAKSRFDS